jgi:hypothetical protein
MKDWQEVKNQIRFYIHHTNKDYKTGKSMTPALLAKDGWWVEIPDISFGSKSLYDYIRRWLIWGRKAEGKITHNFFFRRSFSSDPMERGDWNGRIKTIFERWTGVPVSPNSIRKMFSSQYPEHRSSAAFLLQHSEDIHCSDYDMRESLEKIRPVMEANEQFIQTVLQQTTSQ